MEQKKETQLTQNAFEALFRSNYAAMYRLAYALLHDADVSRDVVQEVFLKVAPRVESSVTEISTAYLLMSVRNTCLNFLARKQREERIRQLLPAEVESSSLSDVLAQEQRWRQICDFVDHELTPQQRSVIRLRYSEDLSYEEVAKRLGISVSAVNKHVVQALRRLRERFGN